MRERKSEKQQTEREEARHSTFRRCLLNESNRFTLEGMISRFCFRFFAFPLQRVGKISRKANDTMRAIQ